MKIAACVILYQPEESVLNNIKSYINHVDKIYIIDNTEYETFSLQPLSAYQTKMVFINDGINKGIAKRLNQACYLVLKDGFKYLLTMDQDSCFDESQVINYFKCIENFADKSTVSMFGINHQKKNVDISCTYNKAKHLITSGSIINLNAYKNIGDFDENLFIDFVDAEYCFRSLIKGYDIIEFPNIFLQHEIGTAIQQRSLKNLRSSKRSIHSAVRLYYMTRNFYYLEKKYQYRFKNELSLYKKDLKNRIKNKLFYGSNHYKTLKYLFKALKDYKQNNMGKQF